MDRRCAAGALLALVACIASTTAAPAASEHTSLDLYDGKSEGCYYNFQHYGEGDRIMTNEPCLNCTCHNRMLMCYLRVCPFTKAIGQDCSVEKRADQCCPIVTCPDVPVDLLTSTSTTSPAEYGGTGVGKVDNYGCTINGKYFPEGSKVPPTPNKPCEHCYCIRNMTTCVMQECTLHVDGCTPIYHKDVCCPVRYFCDHPDDEMPLLDDMTTTERPTPGFLLTTTTEEPTTVTQTRRECVENDQLYPDGALIKTEKPCVHCYCMKGDIVCVVQECGTPMENEGKNCSSLPPREGQCCPDTYICEGDELTTELNTELPFEDITTMQPPRRVSIEGSGYRNEPDELPYTETPTIISEIEGSGEEQEPEKLMPHDLVTPEQDITTEGVHLATPSVTRIPLLEEAEKATTEPDKGLNTVPSGFSDEDSSEPSFISKTTVVEESRITEPSISDQGLITSGIIEEKTPEPSMPEITTLKDDTKASVTESTISYEQRTSTSEIMKPESSEPSLLATTFDYQPKTTEPSIKEEEQVTSHISDEDKPEPSISESATLGSDENKATDPTTVTKLTTGSSVIVKEESTESSIVDRTTHKDESEVTVSPVTIEKETVPSEIHDDDNLESTKTPTSDNSKATEPTIVSEQELGSTEAVEEATSLGNIEKVTEPVVVSEQPTVSSESVEESSSEPSTIDDTTSDDGVKASEPTLITEKVTEPSDLPDKESTEAVIVEGTTMKDIETKSTESPVISGDKQYQDKEIVTTTSDYPPSSLPDSPVAIEEETAATTEPTFRKEDESNTPIDTSHKKEEEHTTPAADVLKETDVTSDFVEPSIIQTVTPSTIEQESKTTTTNITEQGAEETDKKEEPTTESFLELSTFAHITEPDKLSTLAAESEIISTTPSTEKLDLPLTTTINPEENEIDEDVSPISSPGRIPGEGDCLLNGITYKNDSAIPSANKCHSGCRCVSSIVKCDPIICSSPPEYMDNCQLTYDTPNSCCPTYICDHSKETIPPQPHSQMSGTESPIPSPSFECNGDQCKVSEEKQPPILPSTSTSNEPGKKPEDSECGSEDCGTPIQIPVHPSKQPEDCTDGKCDATGDNCVEGKCEQPPITDKAEITPSKEDKIPNISTPTCKGESCATSTDQICDKKGGCVSSVDIPCDGDACELKPQVTPFKDEPEIPETTAPPCEGESCTTVKEQPCNKEDGCEIFVDKKCEGEHCESKEEIPPAKDVPQICDSEGNCKTLDVTSEPTVLPCDGENCDSKPEILPSKDVPQICENGDNCKETKIPDTMSPPCEGDKCEGKPEILPTQDTEKMPEVCANEDDCKQTDIPATAASPCEGDACTITDVSSEPEISKEDEICSDESGCKKHEVSGTDCTEDSCRRAEIPDIGNKVPSDCTIPECMQQEPISPSQETTNAVTIITESPIMEQTSVSEPAQKPVTQQGEVDTESPSKFVTEEQSKTTEIPDLYVTQHEDKITNLPEQIDIDTEIKPSESPDFESPSTAKIELETKTEDISTKVTEIVTDQPSSDSSVIEEKLPEMFTEEPVMITVLPEAYVTGAITQDSSTSLPFEDTITEKQLESTDHSTLLTEEVSPEKENEEPTDEQNILTETPHNVFTEKPEEYATEQENISTGPPQFVGEQDKLQTESPESPNIHVEEGSGASEISVDESAEKTTLAPKISETEYEETKLPEINLEISRTTESPLEQNEVETSTEIKLPELEGLNTKIPESGTDTPVSSESSQEPEIYKTTESPNLESQEVESAEKPEAYTPKTQEIATETPLPAVFDSQDDREQQEMSEIPTKEEEIKTESPVDRITEAEQPFTNALDQSSYDQKTTGAPELDTSEQDIETSTKNIEIFEIDKATKAPETFETEKDTYAESPEIGATQAEEYESKPTARIPTETEQPSAADATKPQDIGHMKPQYDTKTELPLLPTTSYEEIATVPELSVTSEEKIMTESPLSLVTKSQLPDATTEQKVSIPELHETKTETPVLLSTVQPEIPISEEVTKTDMPETHVTKHHETVTETPDQQSTKTDMLETHVTEHHEKVTVTPDQQSTEQEMGTKSPEQLTEEDQQTESPTLTEIDKTPSPTDVPQDTDLGTVDRETELPEMVSEKDTSVTEMEEKRTEASASTELLVTELPEISTKEPHELETKPETEHPLEHPHEETSTEIPVPIFSDENLTDTKVTDASESSVAEEYETGTTVPEQAEEENKMKPDSQENIPYEQGELVTKSPELGTTPEEKYTESSESASEKPEQEEKLPEDNEIITKIPDSSTETPVSVETTPDSAQKPQTNVPQSPESFVPDQELNTEAPAEVVTKEQEIDIESPESHVTVSEIEMTESPEKATTKLEEIEVTESPVSLVTKQEQSSIIPVSFDIETEKSTTESSVSEQEEFTQDPNEALAKPQEFEMKTEEPVSEEVTKTPEILSSEEDMLTVLPVHKETVQAEAVTPEQEDLGTTPSKVEESEHDIHTEPPVSLVTGPESLDTREPESTVTEHEEANKEQENYPESTGSVPIETPHTTESTMEISTKSSIESEQTSEPQHEYSETTPYLVELQQHTHRISDETSTVLASEEPTTASVEPHETKHEQPISEGTTDIPVGVEIDTESSIKETEKPEDEKEATLPAHEEPSGPVEQQTSSPAEDAEKITEPSVIVQETTSESTSTDISDSQKLDERFSTESQKDQEKEVSTTSKPSSDDKEQITVSISSETEKPLIPDEVLPTETEKEQISSTTRPLEHDVPYETTAPEEEFIPAMITKATTVKAEEEITTLPPLFDKFTKQEQKPSEILPSTSAPETPKPGFNELQPTDEVPLPEDDGQFPPSGGYGQEPDYAEEDQAFGPGTCRYGGKVYVSAQQIPRDDPCDFCFCFRSDIICLQQSCPPPIHGCHEEPIQGFCCPRYECPVSMATSLNVTTTTTTTTTTLPPHFLPHAYKGAAQRRGCQIKGHTYKVGEVVRASSGPCLHCTCGGDGQMKCDPKACTPEPMLRQMIAAAVSAKRRR